MRKWLLAPWAVLLVVAGIGRAQESPDDLAQLRAAFQDHSGIELVFEASELPAGVYHDLMVALPTARRAAALKIAAYEARKLPKYFLHEVGIKAIGVFDSCASRQGDGFRPFDKQLGGYRYFGIYNGSDAVAAAYYTDEQLPLTFHHETFHHIDHTTDPAEIEDRRWAQILAGKNLYPAASIKADDLAALKNVSRGNLLIGAVSEYAKKNPAEDKAETARYLMSALPDSLVQITEQPELAGSQRILHILDKYRRALKGKGPTIDWFVNVALSIDAPTVTARLRSFGAGDTHIGDNEARKLLQDAERLATTKLEASVAVALADASAAATQQLLRKQIDPRDDDRRFVVLGAEDADGVNWTLRSNVTNFGQDAARLAVIAAAAPKTSDQMLRTQLQNLRLLSRFYVFIAQRWQVTERTREIFERARNQFATALATSDPGLAARLKQLDLATLAEGISPQGDLWTLDNKYSKNIDAEIEDPALRRVIRSVQPACVRLGGGSGINVSPDGRILTAAHVAHHARRKLIVEFPDGREYGAVCTAIDEDLDLAICSITTDDRLPFARVGHTPPREGAPVVCIGQPGAQTPTGKLTGYQPFNVSTGAIRGFVGDPLGSQKLGRTKHDAWTYWGHSGSPLFDERGEVVALHNSWDPSTAMRHAVTQQAIAKFLKDCELEESVAPPSRLEE